MEVDASCYLARGDGWLGGYGMLTGGRYRYTRDIFDVRLMQKSLCQYRPGCGALQQLLVSTARKGLGH